MFGNYSFMTLISSTASRIELDRTRPTVTRVATAHALFTGQWSLRLYSDEYNFVNRVCILFRKHTEEK